MSKKSSESTSKSAAGSMALCQRGGGGRSNVEEVVGEVDRQRPNPPPDRWPCAKEEEEETSKMSSER